MKAIQESFLPKPDTAYGVVYEDTRSMITVLSGMTDAALEDAATELSVDYDCFVTDYDGPYLADTYIGFAEMLRQWGPLPWSALEFSSLNGLTLAQFFLAWAWGENNAAKYCLDGEAVANGWKPEVALNCGVISAVNAAKSLSHARYLMASGGNKLGMEAA